MITMSNTEPDFKEDLEQTQEAVTTALNALTDVKAYTLKADEIADFKAAQYALRNLSEEHQSENVADLYKESLIVTGDESDYY